MGVANTHAQKFPDRGVPLISNYPPEHYGRVGKVWDIQSANNGIVYFASDQGLLEYDGQRWRSYEGSKGFTRSLLIAADSVLYSGADKDFGRWKRDDLAQFSFTSLNPFRESTKGLNEEFWGTYQIEEDYVFVSFDNIYVYRKGQLTKRAAPSRFYGSFTSGGKIYLFDEESGLYQFDGLSLTQRFNFPPSYTTSPVIVGIHNSREGLLIVTRSAGTFQFADGSLRPLANEVTPFLERDQVFSFTSIDSTHYAFGTILNGVYITDLKGKIIQHVNKQKGLLNNTILSLHYSKLGQLWLGMDFGISTIDLRSDVTYFLDEGGQVGTGYTGLLHQGTFYLGTNQGLYYTDWDDLKNDASLPDFSLVPGSSGQVWALSVADGTVLCGHDRGLFRVSRNTLTQLHDEAGVLTIRQLDDEHLLTGNYNGISLFQKSANGWSFVRKIAPVQGACNQILPAEDEVLWLNLPNFGIIRASLNEADQISDQTIVRDDLFPGTSTQLFQDADTLKVVTEQGMYAYLPSLDSFVTTPLSTTTLQVQNRLAGAHRPTLLDPSYGFIPVHNGFALKKAGNQALTPSISPLTIHAVEAFSKNDTQLVAPGGEAPNRLNNVRIHFVVPQQDQVRYQHHLENHGVGWSDWGPKPHIDYLDLAAGNYTFHLRAKIGDRLLPEQSVSFTIASSWYRTPWAYALYAALLIALLYLTSLWRSHKLQQQKHTLEAKELASQQLKAAAEEQENLQKRYEMLDEAVGEIRKQLRSKTIELIRKAKENDEKGRILHILKEKVDGLDKKASPTKFQLGQLGRILANYTEIEDDSFSIQMGELHQNLLAKLSERYPELTNYDKRLCAYLKSGLTTREIAELMNVLPSSVNVSRSRLRKKLRLGSKEDLYKFLNSIE
jgi:DNA-binding CsgD family transcriptional regulator